MHSVHRSFLRVPHFSPLEIFHKCFNTGRYRFILLPRRILSQLSNGMIKTDIFFTLSEWKGGGEKLRAVGDGNRTNVATTPYDNNNAQLLKAYLLYESPLGFSERYGMATRITRTIQQCQRKSVVMKVQQSLNATALLT